MFLNDMKDGLKKILFLIIEYLLYLKRMTTSIKHQNKMIKPNYILIIEFLSFLYT